MDPNVSNAIVNTFTNFLNTIPQLVWALIVLLIGFLIANIVRSLVLRGITSLHIQKMVSNLGFKDSTIDKTIGHQIANTFAEIIRWLIILVFLISFFNMVGLESISQFLIAILNYVPNIAAASIIFIIAILLAGFAEKWVKSTLSPLNPLTARLCAKIVSYSLVIIGSLIALSELKIAEYFINVLFIGFVATLTLAIGLSFGLGAKDVVKTMLSDWYDQLQHSPKKPT